MKIWTRARTLGRAAAVLVVAAVAMAFSAPERQDPIVKIAVPNVFPAERLPAASQSEIVAVLIRGPNIGEILVFHPDHVSAAALSTGGTAVARIQEAMPSPDRGMTSMITSDRVRAPSKPLPAIESALNRLESSPVTEIGDLGQGRWIEVPLSVLTNE